MKAGSRVALVALSLTLLVLVSPIFSVGAYTSPAAASDLVAQYAPVLKFNKAENFYPVSVDYAISRSSLRVMTLDGSQLVSSSVDSAALAGYSSESYYLDNTVGDFSEILSNYQQAKSGLGYTVYARMAQMNTYTVVQYWFFYAYNDAAMNQHEGDWECVTILFSGNTPVYAAYSQHESGQRAAWSDVELEGTHPVVYVAKGSHANYYRSYQGKLGAANDDVGGDGLSLQPFEYIIVALGEPSNHPPDQGWLDYGGRWGDWAKLADASMGMAGPFGPAKGENETRWAQATSWAFMLPQIDRNALYLDLAMANLLLIFLGISGVQALWKLIGITRVARSGGLRISVVMRSRAAIGVVMGFLGVIVGVGAAFLPYYLVRANIETSVLTTGGTVDIVKIDALNGIAVNLLSSGGIQPLGAASIPFGILIAAGVVLTILDLIGVQKVKKLGGKYLTSGVFFFIYVAAIYAAVVLLLGNMSALASSLGVDYLPPEVATLTSNIASNPIQGAASINMTGIGSVYLEWGVQLGAYMLVASALLRVVGGLLLLFSPELPESTR